MRTLNEFHVGSRAMLLAVAVFTILIAAIDLSTANLNLGILYVVPMLILGVRSSERWHVFTLGGLFVLLTYGGFFLGRQPDPGGLGRSVPLINRTFAAITIVVTAMRCDWWIRDGAVVATEGGDIGA